MSQHPPAAGYPDLRHAVALARVRQLLHQAPQAPWLHEEVARRMTERLALLMRTPNQVLDWSGPEGASGRLLQQALPRATVQVRAAALPKTGWWERLGRTPSPGFEAVARAGQAQMVWSNMQLQWAESPDALFSQWHGALAKAGLLFFSTLGPGTLAPLQALYAAQGWPLPMAPLADMHDLGDALVSAGFADPVMDQETLTLTWPGPAELLAELRSLGRNAHPRRHTGLRGRQWHGKLTGALEALRKSDGRLHLPFEIVYGHATRGTLGAKMEGTTHVPLSQMQRMMRGG